MRWLQLEDKYIKVEGYDAIHITGNISIPIDKIDSVQYAYIPDGEGIIFSTRIYFLGGGYVDIPTTDKEDNEDFYKQVVKSRMRLL